MDQSRNSDAFGFHPDRHGIGSVDRADAPLKTLRGIACDAAVEVKELTNSISALSFVAVEVHDLAVRLAALEQAKMRRTTTDLRHPPATSFF